MSTAPVDMTKMSAAEIRAFIESQNAGTPADEQPRDEQGRFIAAEPEPEVPAEPEAEVEAEPVVVEREIDLGDGSGVQVFRGVGATETDALAALADELVKAQTNATQKIRELSRPAPTVDPATAPENEFLLQQKLLDSPRATLRQIFKDEFGMSPAEIKAKLAVADQVARDQEEGRVADAFIAANPDYAAIPQNGRRIERQLKLEGLPATVENLQKVYEDLKADGLIVAKAAAATTTARPRSSGLSTRTSVAPPPPAAVDTRKLTTEQLRELAGGYQSRW